MATTSIGMVPRPIRFGLVGGVGLGGPRCLEGPGERGDGGESGWRLARHRLQVGRLIARRQGR